MEQNSSNSSYQQQPATPPKNWLVEAILVTIFCCLPFGIVGIVFASQVNSKYSSGDYSGALQASREAGKWTKIGFWLGIAGAVIGILWGAFLGGWAYFMTRYHHY
jgi:hypothetical protein